MYLDHYRLTIKPFDLSPKPDFLWLGEKHKEALATLKYGIVEDKGFLLLTGDVGVGKTALIHRLIRSLDPSTLVAHITDPGLGTLDFFRIMAAQFNIPTEFSSKGEFLIALEKFLYQAHADHQRILLIIDEAQRLNNKLIDQVRVLSNIELSDRKLINIFLVGQPEFKNMLLANINRPLRQRIAVNYHIEPLSESETRDYIEYRMAVAGASWDVFEPNALREVYRYTAGFPRAINIICDHALLTGYSSGADTIDAAVIRECENELRISKGFNFKQTDARQSTPPPTWPEIQKRPDPAGSPGPTASSPSRPRPSSPPAALPRTFVATPEPRRGRSGVYSLVVGACILLTALVGYFWLWPQSSETIQMPSAQEVGETDAADQGQSDAETPEPLPPPGPALPDRSQTNSTPPLDNGSLDNAATGDQKPADSDALAEVAPAPSTSATDPAPVLSTEAGREVADGNPADDIPANDLQAIVGTAEAAATPEPSRDNPDRANDLAVPDKSLAAMATLSATLVTDSEKNPEAGVGNDRPAEPAASQEADHGASGPAAPAKETASTTAATPPPKPASQQPEPQAAPKTPQPAVEKADTATRAAVASNPKPTPAPDPAPKKTPPADESKPGPGLTEPANTATNLAASTAVSSPKINPPAAAALSAGGSAVRPPSPGKTAPTTQAPPTPPATGRSGGTTEALAVATAPTAPSAAQAVVETMGLEERLELFLESYCDTYTSKDLAAFTDLFAAGATENGQPFRSLLPKYEKNFTLIDTIQYRIRMKDYSVEDEQTVTVNGDFFLEWLPPDKRWRENSGKISMRLKDDGSTFLVQRLEYKGNQPKQP